MVCTPVFCSHSSEVNLSMPPQSQLSLQAMQNGSAAFKLSVVASLPWTAQPALLLSVIYSSLTAHTQLELPSLTPQPLPVPSLPTAWPAPKAQPCPAPPSQGSIYTVWLSQDCSSQNGKLIIPRGGRGGNTALDTENTPAMGPRTVCHVPVFDTSCLHSTLQHSQGLETPD